MYHEGALDESGEHEPTSVCDSQRAYNFTTLYAARKFMRAVKHRRQRNENIQETTGFFNRSESVSPTNIPFSSSPLTHALSQSDSQRRLLPSGLSNHYMSTDDDKSESENATGLEDDEHAPLSLWQDFIVLKNIIASNGLHLLLLVIPVAVLSDELKWKASLTFLLSSLAVIPLVSTSICSPIEGSTCPFPNNPSLFDTIARTGEFIGRIHRRVGCPFKPMCRWHNKCIVWKRCGSHCSSAGSKS